MALLDLWDQATLTRIIQKPLQAMREDQPFLGEQIAGFSPIQSRVAKLRVYDIVAFGLGQFKAPDASLPLYKPQTSMKEIEISLALLEEAEKIEYEDYLKLNSPDENVQRAAGMNIVTRGRVLALRNRRLTEWMRWQAFINGSMTVTYPTGQSLFIDYGYTAGQKPTAGTLWSDTTNADPTSDIGTWSSLVATNSGFFGDRVHMTSKVWNYLILNAKIKNMLNFYAAGANTIQRPRLEDIKALWTSFYTGVEPVIYDNGYRAQGVTGLGWPGTITKYLPDNKILITAGGDTYTLDGTPIADTLDGQVIVGDDPGADPQIVQGEQSEILYDHISKVWFLRTASARMPRLNYPEAFVAAQVAA